jgi:putative copper export protein
MDSIGFYIMVALLGAGAAYGLANKGKPKPALSAKKRRVAITCLAVAVGCASLAVAVGLLSQHPPAQ